MKSAPFTYHAPDGLDEVLDLLTELGDEARIIAGGQSLVPMMAMRLASPANLVDVNRVVALAGIAERDGDVTIGATTRDRHAERSPVVARHVPLLAEALPFVGHEAIRNRGTVGGSIAHADASAELPAVAVITDATVVARSGRGERSIPARSFFRGHYSTALDDDECLVEVRIPISPAGAGWSIHEVARRHGDFALAGAAAMVVLGADGTIGSARLCLFAVAEVPVRIDAVEAALVGTDGADATLAEAAEAAARDLDPPSDVHGSGAYRRHLAQVTARRALATAVERARQGRGAGS